MKFKVLSTVVFLYFSIHSQAVIQQPPVITETDSKPASINIDSLVQSALSDTASNLKKEPTKVYFISKQDLENLTSKGLVKIATLSPTNDGKAEKSDSVSQLNSEPVKIDSVLLMANPFFIELVYNGLSNKDKISSKTDLKALLYGKKSEKKQPTPEEIIAELRKKTRDEITRKAAHVYIMTFDELPDPNTNRTRIIAKKPITNVEFDNEDEIPAQTTKLIVKSPQVGPWQYKVNSQAQFSESVISANWYQGGNSNLAVLGILNGQLTYDDKKNIQWDNFAEWRMGFNSVAGDTIHWLSTNDDILKINSKLGIKAGGNFFYSGSVDFSTQFFNSFKGLNSYELKAAFLAPVRLNIGVGLDYKYQKIFSVMLSPFSYKYIYVNPVVEPIKGKPIDPNLFGIKTGQNVLSEIGSSFKATYSAPITKEIQLDSKFSFYTNYQKVEIDWEIVANMSINRFLSTRISFNPRYDNTVIEKDGSVARLQFKQFLSVGFSHKFL